MSSPRGSRSKIPQKKFPETRQIETFFNHALEQFSMLPGVEAAAFMNGEPFTHFGSVAQAPRKEASLYGVTLMLRTAQDSETLLRAVRQRLRELDPDQPILRIATVDARIADSIKPQEFNMTLMSLFAVLALTLAVIGLYGVLTYTVVQRSHLAWTSTGRVPRCLRQRVALLGRRASRNHAGLSVAG